MIKMAIRNLFYNKKRTLMIILSICLSSCLLLIISLLFSSVHDFMVKEVSKEKPYHVLIKTKEFDKNENIKTVTFKNGEALIKYNEIRDTYKNTDLLCQKIKCEKVSYNDSLLSLYGLSKKENVLASFKSLLVTVLLILGFGVFILITNAFSISLTEREKQISALKSMGMTKWQFIIMSIKEVLIVLIIGLVVSLIFSFWIMQLLLVIINYLLMDIFSSKLVLTIYPSFLIIAIVFIVVLVLASSLLPIIKVNRLNIIGTISSNNIKNKKLPRWTNKFKITKKLAFYNYYRSKKKYRVITFCIFISVLLYTAFSLYLSYGMNTINSYTKNFDYDLEVIGEGNDEVYKELNKLGQDYEKHKAIKSCLLKGKIDVDSYLDKNDYTKDKQILVIENKEEKIINHIAQIKEEDGRLVKENRPYLKDKVLLDISPGKEIKTTDEIPFGTRGMLNKENVLFLTDDFDKYCPQYEVNLFIKGDSDKALKELKKIENIDVSYVDVKKALKLKDNLLLVVELCLYGVLALVVLVGLSSIVNTVHASLNSRIKEFGLLFSMGLTKKQLNKLLLFESLFMLIKAFILVIPFILMINYILYYSVNMVFEVNIIWPFKEILFSFVVSLLLIYLTLKITYKSFYRKEIISMITSDNV